MFPPWFCFGVPQPKACELPNEVGRVGAERRCISDRGIVIQRITEWSPPGRLRFQMVTTDHTWGPCVESLEEDFQMELQDAGTKITRTTTIRATRKFSKLKELGFYSGLKRVHRYVFKNWRASTEQVAS